MGIYCETDIQTPSGGVFVPGDIVTGVVRYRIDDDTSVDEIIISLKGVGNLNIIKDQGSKHSTSYHNKEKYVNIGTIVKLDDSKLLSSSNTFETEFNFILPDNIPSSLDYHERQGSYKVDCKILYKIRAKFIVPGLLSFNKKFAKEIQVVSTSIVPELKMIPNIYGQRRKLFQPLRKVRSIVNIKAIVQNSVILPGGEVEIAYEVLNNTNLALKAIKTKVLEVYDFYAYNRHIVQMIHKVNGLESKTGSVKSRDTFKFSCQLILPAELHSIENSKLLKRSYAFLIAVKLPVPYRNVNLKIPLQVGFPVSMENAMYKSLQIDYPAKKQDASDDDLSEAAGMSYEPPPSYWQSVEKLKKSSIDYEENPESKDEYDDHDTGFKKKL